VVRLVFGVHVLSSSILVQIVHVQPRPQRRDSENEVSPGGTQRLTDVRSVSSR